MVTAMDDAIGNVTRALIDKDMLHNTVIVFMSDVRIRSTLSFAFLFGLILDSVK